MKKLLIIFLLCGSAINGSAQQSYQFTNFFMNDYYYNPAIVGSKPVHFANIGFRAQWAGFDEAPKTMYANFYGSVKNKMQHGYGVSIINDRSGLVSNTGFMVNYAYHLKLNEKNRLGFGIRPGYQQFNFKLYDAQLADEVDPTLNGNVLSTGAFDLSAGLNFYSDKYFIMASMEHILADSLSFTGFNAGLSRHYNFIAGYKWLVNKKKTNPGEGNEDGEGTETNRIEVDSSGVPIPMKKKKDFELMPVIMVNYVRPVTPQASIMLRATYDNKYWLGVSYRTQDALGISLGIVIKERLNISYSYDYSMGDLQGYNGGSHEIMLRFQTTSKKKTLDEEDEELNNSIFDENKSNKKKEK